MNSLPHEDRYPHNPDEDAADKFIQSVVEGRFGARAPRSGKDDEAARKLREAEDRAATDRPWYSYRGNR